MQLVLLYDPTLANHSQHFFKLDAAIGLKSWNGLVDQVNDCNVVGEVRFVVSDI